MFSNQDKDHVSNPNQKWEKVQVIDHVHACRPKHRCASMVADDQSTWLQHSKQTVQTTVEPLQLPANYNVVNRLTCTCTCSTQASRPTMADKTLADAGLLMALRRLN